MSTDFLPDDSDPGGELGREVHGTSGSNFVGGDQDGWQTPDADAFTGTLSYPAPGSAAGPQYPGYGGYQTPSVGQSDYAGGSVLGSAPRPGAPGYPGAPGGSGYPGYGGHTSTLAPKPSIIPLWPLSIGKTPGGVFKSLRANLKAMFIPSLVVTSIVGLLSAGSFALFLSRFGLPNLTSGKIELSGADLDKIGASLVGLLVQLGVTSALSMIATSIITGLLIVTVSRTVLDRKTSLGGVWQRVWPQVWAPVGQMLLIELILITTTAVVTAIAVGIGRALLGNVIVSGAAEDSAGTIALAILAILVVIAVSGLVIFALMCKLCLMLAAPVLGNIGVIEGIFRSQTLTRGYFWHIVGIHLFSPIIIFFASWIVSQGASIIMQGFLYAASDTTLATLMASMLLSSLVQAAILLLDSAVIALMHTDLRMRSESLDVELHHVAGV